jgi:hypothetical protein
MNCPRCVREIPYATLTCGECGFSLFDQDAQFGNDAVRINRVTNAANLLTENELALVNTALLEFEGRFPQLFLAIYHVSLPIMASVRQFGFWLLNRAAINGLEATRPNEHGALLVIDETSGQAGLVVGYLLECYFPETELAEIMENARKDWAAGRMAAGLLEVVSAFTVALQKKSKLAAKSPSKFAPATEPVPPGKPEFTRVHEPAPEAAQSKTNAEVIEK